MNLLDYKNFFNGVTRAFVEQPDFYTTFIRHGFDPLAWPDCESKGVAIEFDRLARDKGVDYAQLHLQRRVGALPDYPFQPELSAMLCEFNEFKIFGLYRELGQALLANAARGPEILAGFKAHNKSLISVNSFREQAITHAEKRRDDAKAGVQPDVTIKNWETLSGLIGGFNPGRVILLVAGTGVGKTTLALNIMLSATETMPTLCFNMEMMLGDVYDRLIMCGAGIPISEWKTFGTDHEAVDFASKEKLVEKKVGTFISRVLGNHDLLVTDGRALTIEQITSEIYRQQEFNGVKIVFVDYDQKIRTKYQGEEWQTLQRAVEELEETAKATGTCIVILAQGDENNMPKASKRSMQSASAVLAFYREGSTYFIETKKNRFGKNRVKIKAHTLFDRYQITSGDTLYDATDKPALTRDIYAMDR